PPARRGTPTGSAGPGSGRRSRAGERYGSDPAGVQRLALGVSGGALDADDGLLGELLQRPGAGVGAGGADARDDRVDQVLDAGAVRVQEHAGGGDPLLEQRLAGAVVGRLLRGAVAHGTRGGHAEGLLVG